MADAEEPAGEQYDRWWAETGEHELRQLLLWRWDPIGVADSFPSAADEYDGYAPALADLLRRGATEAEVAAHLEAIERDTIGLPATSSERLDSMAELPMARFAASVRSWSRHGPVRR